MKRVLSIVACCFIWACYMHPAWGVLDIRRPFPSTFNLGSWSGQGDVSVSGQGCIRSYVAFWFFPFAQNYQVRVGTDSPGEAFTLRHEDNPSETIPFRLDLADLIAGGFQTLTTGVFSSDLTYETYWCDSGDDAELTMSVLASDLFQVPAGRYTVLMDVEARRSSDTSERDTQSGIQAEITVDELVRISNIDDIDLGNYNGVDPVAWGEDSYCVYTNAGDYTITPSTASGSYTLRDSNNNEIEYSVRLNNAANGAAGFTAGHGETLTFAPNQSTPLSVNCSGGDNAAVYVEIPGAVLQAVPAGTYSGTLTLQVAPI